MLDVGLFPSLWTTPFPGLPPHWEDWDEDKTRARLLLALKFMAPPSPAPRLAPEYLLSPRGTFAYENVILPAGMPLELCGKQHGLVIWDDDVVLPTLVDMNLNGRNGKRFAKYVPEKERAAWGMVWMSLTPSEMLSQRSGVAKANGKVVIGGLGLGWFMKKLSTKDTVTEIVVVEKSQELLDWYGYKLCEKYPKVKEVICNDVYQEIGRHGDCEYLLDIWPIYAGAINDPRLRAARKVVGERIWAWGMD